MRQENPSENLEKESWAKFIQHSVDTLGYNGDLSEFAFTCRDGEELLGCVWGRSFYGGLYIKYLIIDQTMRRKGLGTSLMEKALQKGRELGCQFACLETLSFQALGFYQKLGFVLEFTSTGYSHGVSKHYLRKEL